MSRGRSGAVSVITVTRKRRESLLRAVKSVCRQSYEGSIEHIIIGDESQALRELSGAIRDCQSNAVIRHVITSEHQGEFNSCYIPARLGFLRNIGIRLSTADYVCYLDDDNTFEPDHIASLVSTIEKSPRVDISYSWRYLRFPNGRPYTLPEYIWTPQARLATGRSALSRHIFAELVAGGVRIPGDAVVRDAVIDSRGHPVYTVDTNELMVRRKVHERFEFVVDFMWRDMVGDFSDDYAFIKRCHESGLIFRSSEKPTVNYYIGGVSNARVSERRS